MLYPRRSTLAPIEAVLSDRGYPLFLNRNSTASVDVVRATSYEDSLLPRSINLMSCQSG